MWINFWSVHIKKVSLLISCRKLLFACMMMMSRCILSSSFFIISVFISQIHQQLIQSDKVIQWKKMAYLVTLTTIFAILPGIIHSIRVSNPSNPDFVSFVIKNFGTKIQIENFSGYSISNGFWWSKSKLQFSSRIHRQNPQLLEPGFRL